MSKYIVVINRADDLLLSNLRHIIMNNTFPTLEEAIADYYRVYKKLDGDEFFVCANWDEVRETVDREVCQRE